MTASSQRLSNQERPPRVGREFEVWNRRLRGARGPLAAALVAVVVHGLFLLALPDRLQANESTDFLTFYRPVAENLAAGRGLVDSDGQAAIRYPPGFPVLLAPFVAGGERALDLFAALAIALASGLHFAWARRATGSAALAGLASLVASTYLPWLWAGKQPNSELPFAALFFAALWAFQGAVGADPTDRSRSVSILRRAAWAVAAGTLAGWAALVRPIAIGLSFALAASVLLGSAMRRQAADSTRSPLSSRPSARQPMAPWAIPGLLVAAQLVVMAPWVLHLHQETDRWMPLSTGGRLSMLDGLTYAIDPAVRTPDALPEGVVELMRTLRERRADLGQPPQIVAWLARHSLDEPVPVVSLLAIKAARAWYGTESLRLDRWLVWVQIPYLALAAAGLLLMWRRGGPFREFGLSDADPRGGLRPDPRQLVTTLCTVTALFWGMTVLVLSILRYMLPVMALLTVPMAIAMLATGRRLTRGRASLAAARSSS